MNKYKIVGMTATFRGERGLNMIKALLQDAAVIKVGAVEPERKLQLDVFGNLQAAEVDSQVIKVAKDKQQEMAIIIILPSISKCEKIKHNFQHCFIFGEGEVFSQLGCLQMIQAQQNPYPIIITTADASLGQDIVDVAYVIQVTVPDFYSTFVQNAGRSNRIDPTASLVGALITTEPILTIEAVKVGCEFKQQRQKLFRADYFQSLQYMECCCFVDYSLPTFKSAKKLLMNGTSAVEIYKALTKAPKFRVALEMAGLTQSCDNTAEVLAPNSLPNNSVQQPEGVQQKEEGFSIVGKRKEPEKELESLKAHQERKGIASYFKQISSSGIQVKEQQALPQKNAQQEVEVSAFADDQPENKDKDEQSFKQLSPKKTQLNPGVLKEKELEEARAVFAKHGFAVPEPVTKKSKSRTSSEMLFGENGSNKKRDEKAGGKAQEKQDKMERESQRSGESNLSGVSRSTNGRFEGSTQFGENIFKKRGTDKGFQRWACLSCKKRTIEPLKHKCV